MKHVRDFFSLAILLLLAMSLSSQVTRRSPAESGIEHVWIISVDGLSPDGFLSGESHMHADFHGPRAPTLRETVEHGVYAERLLPVLPADSYPSAVTIATGCNPSTHGITTNKAWDPAGTNLKGWRWYAEDIKAPTIWDLARDHGLTTALIGWPATVGAKANLLVPDFWRANTSEDVKLLRAMATDNFIKAATQEYPNLPEKLFEPRSRDEAYTDLGLYAIQIKQPNLLMLHLIGPVFAQHVYGLSGQETNHAYENIDQQIGRLILEAKKIGIWDSTVIVVVSGFSFGSVSESLYPGTLLAESGLVTLDQNRIRDWKAVLVSNDGTAYVYVQDQNDETTLARLRDIFKTLLTRSDSGISRVIFQPEITNLGGDPRAFLAIEAADGFTIEDGYDGPYKRPTNEHATHGFLPDEVKTQGTAIIYGPMIKEGRLDNGRLVDIAPTIAQWLNLELKMADGIPLNISLWQARPAVTR